MAAPDCSSITRLVILKADRLYAESLRVIALSVFPNATVAVATSVQSATHSILESGCDILITGLGTPDTSDVLAFLGTIRTRSPATRILVVSTHWDQRVLTELRALRVHGIFDAAKDGPEDFTTALRNLGTGRRSWSASILNWLNLSCSAPNCLARLLTTVEQMVLSVIGDGSDDAAAALELGLSPATISTVRRELHRKLGVQHRGALVRVAAQNGFVRFTPGGVVRPGFELLIAAHRARRPRAADKLAEPVAV